MKLKVKKAPQEPSSFDPTPKFLGWKRSGYEAVGMPEIDVMTCKEFDPKYLKKYPGEWIAQDKLDARVA